MSNYNHTTLLTFRNALIKALDSDSTVSNFWPNSELDKIIQQALLAFGGLSGFFKDNIIIATEENKRVYDIFTDTSQGTSFTPSITYGDIIDWLNIDLIESISESNPTSALFSLNELLNLIDSKYNLFQSETNLIISKAELNVLAQNNLVKFADNVLDIVRLKYKYTIDSIDFEVILQREDEDSIAAFDIDALTEERVPIYWSTVFGSPNEIRLFPIPNLTGTLEVISINSRDTSNTLTVDTIVNLPNNLAPYLKYHVLQDIYNKDGVLNDPAKAAYCAKRWNEGLTLGKNYSSILIAKSNGIAIQTDSMNKLDSYTDILDQTDGAPNVLGLAGFNIFEIDTLPNSVVNSIQLVINKDAPTLINDNDSIDIEIGYIDPLMNYCIHLAQFKCGAEYLAATNEYLQDFLRISLSHNSRLLNKGITYENLLKRSKLEEIQIPRLVEMNQQQAQTA